MAETLNEAAVLGVKTMNVPDERLYLLSLDALVKPRRCTTRFRARLLNAWFAQPDKTPKEQALKFRLKELLRIVRHPLWAKAAGPVGRSCHRDLV
jgi:hypothetical protein